MELILPETSTIDPGFNIIIPRPFVLSEQPRGDLDKIKEEIMDKDVNPWESRMSPFFKGYNIIADSWRIRPSDQGVVAGKSQGSSPKTLFNSKSGETHRAAETLATFWFNQLTASDPPFDTAKRGLNPDGSEVTQEQLYLVAGVIIEQLKASKFKKKLMRTERSKATFGVAVVEEPFVSLPYGYGQKYMEFTDWVFRPMTRTGFDTTVSDIEESDYIFFIDFVTKWMLLNQASQDSDYWDRASVELHIKNYAKGGQGSTSPNYSRVSQSRSRAGYSDVDAELYETINYHGRLDPENPVIGAYAESVGLQEDPRYVDWSACVLDGQDMGKFHMTQYGSWRTRAKVLSFKEFEDECIPYGVGQLGRKLQRMMDIVESLADDKATFDILNMWKRGAYGGDSKQFIAEPQKIVDVEDVAQLMPLIGDPNVLRQVLQMLALRREDFRDIVGAKTNLQGEVKDVSATEASLAQNESVRAAASHGSLDADVLRAHLEIMHINNLNYLDEPIWVSLTGTRKPRLVSKDQLPSSVGFLWKVVTDKDFRPEEKRNILQALQILTSAKSLIPPEIVINGSMELLKELFRKYGKDPALLTQPVSQQQLLEMRLNRLLTSRGAGNELGGEMYGDGTDQAAPESANAATGPVPNAPGGGEGITEASAA